MSRTDGDTDTRSSRTNLLWRQMPRRHENCKGTEDPGKYARPEAGGCRGIPTHTMKIEHSTTKFFLLLLTDSRSNLSSVFF